MCEKGALDRLWQDQLEMIKIFNSADDFYDILAKYIRLRQMPRFFSAMFSSLNVIDTASNNSILFPEKFLRKLAEEIAHLPSGQIKEIWDICTTNSSNLLKKARIGNEANWLELQLTFEIFRIFMLHVKIEDSSLIEHFRSTTNLLNEALEICVANKVSYAGFSVLSLCHAWGEMQLAMKQYVKDFTNPASFENISHLYDLSGNHYYFSSHNWINVLHQFSDDKEMRTQYFIALLLLQKARAILLGADNLSAVQAITNIIDYIIKNSKLVAFAEADSEWNGEPTYIITDTYPVALWCCILKHIPCLINVLKAKHWLYLASRITEILFTASEDNEPLSGQSVFILTKQFLEGPFFSEIRPLQSAYLTEILKLIPVIFRGKKRKRHSSDSLSDRETLIWNLSSSEKVWMKLADTTPKYKDPKSLNELWEIIKKVSEMLSNILNLEENEKINMEALSRLLKLIEYLPLEYLLPGNQMRCLLALITFIGCIPGSSKNKENSVSCVLMVKVCKIILAILDGARSVWLLSFIDASLMLKTTVKVMCSFLTETSCLHSQEVLKWLRQLLNSFVSLSMRSVPTLISLQEFTKDIASTLCSNECSEPVIICACVLFSRFNDALCKSHILESYEGICRESAELLTSALTNFIRNKEKFESEVEMECYKELIDFKCLSKENIEILNLQKVIEQELLSLQKGDTVLHDANVKFFTTICKNREVLNSCIPENFAQKLWFSASKFYEKQLESVMPTQCKNTKGNMVHLDEIRRNLIKYLIERCAESQKKSVVQQSFEIPNDENDDAVSGTRESEILQVSIKCASTEEYENIVRYTAHLTDNIGNLVAALPLLQLWKIIVGSVRESSHTDVLRVPITDLIRKLFCLVGQQKCQSERLKILVPILDFCTLALHKGKGLLIHQSILICMEICVLTPLQKLIHQSELYIHIFEHVYRILNEIMIQHFHCVLGAPSCFLACVSYLLSCQIQASNQNIVMQCNSSTQKKLDICAQKLCKLMSLISERKVEFSKLVATIIGTYVNEVEKVTVFPPIKEHLLIGLNKLIKICDNHFLYVLQKTLKHGSKEVFKTVLNEHKSYFRYHGHV